MLQLFLLRVYFFRFQEKDAIFAAHKNNGDLPNYTIYGIQVIC